MSISIIGGGISGLSLAYYLKTQQPSVDVTVYESENRAGGKIWTQQKNGFLLEGGVNGFLSNKPETLRLASLIGLSPLSSNEAAKERHVFVRNKLHKLPESPVSFFKSPLLSVPGRVRLVLEALVPRSIKEDETLNEFATRRLGKEAFETMIDPMASGIYAGDPAELELRSAFPRIYNLENKHGSLIRGMIKMQWEARKTKKTVGPGPGGVLTSFENGMGQFIDALCEKLPGAVKTAYPLKEVKQDDGTGYMLLFENGEEIKTDILVLATPAHNTATLLDGYDKELSSMLRKIPYPEVDVVCMGLKEEALKKPFTGFGFLVPGKEKRKTLGTLGDSNIFANRAPDGYILLRTMVGGQRHGEFKEMDDESIKQVVLDEINDIFGLKEDPVLFELFRHSKAIPQYNKGHNKLLKDIYAIMENHPYLYLHGNAYKGISVNDCIEKSLGLSKVILESGIY